MRLLIQRVKEAKVVVHKEVIGQIGHGLLVFLGVHKKDTEKEIDYLVRKLANLRIFEDEEGKMNLNVQQVKGKILLVSQFTLYGNTERGNRPDFMEAAPPDKGEAFYNLFIQKLETKLSYPIETGKFGAYMRVSLVNDGPVTFAMEKLL